jgi:hypothetical protein
LIDGQQRLTTLWLLLRFMQQGRRPAITLEYADPARQPGVPAAELDAGASSEQNIDYFHIHQAHIQPSPGWFAHKMGAAVPAISGR